MPDEPLMWLGSSRRDLGAFPVIARRLTGFQLRRVQQGLEPDDWKPMPTVGPGVQEIRIHIDARTECSRVREEDAEDGGS